MGKRFNQTEKSWMYYDWANSAYSIIITTAVFPLYYKSVANAAGVFKEDSTAFLAYTVSLATFILAMIGPILGTIADYRGLKKKFFLGFFLLGSFATVTLAFVPSDNWLALLIIYLFTAIGFHGANIFYDAFLVDATVEEKMDEVSARGFSLGYIGSTIPFILSIALILLANTGKLPFDVTAVTRFAFILTGVWWFAFTIPMLKNVVQQHGIERESKIIKNSFRRLFKTFKEIKRYRHVFLFLLAYFFYIDGVGTIITMSTAYGSDLGIDATSLLLILLLTQIVAAPFAVLYGRLAKKYTAKPVLYVGIFIYVIVCIYAFFLETTIDFWILAMLVATSQGGIQALSRSYYAQLVPKEKSNEFFGFYNIFGKFASVMGPLLVGFTAQLTGHTAYGVFSLIVLFIVGGLLLFFVPNPEKKLVKQV